MGVYKNNKIDFIRNSISIIAFIFLIYFFYGIWGYDGSDKIGKIQVYKSDIGKMNWEDANFACASLGNGWRLPTINELELINKNKDDIEGFFKNCNYWTSSENLKGQIYVIRIGGPIAEILDVTVFGNYRASDKSENYYVRPVRSLK